MTNPYLNMKTDTHTPYYICIQRHLKNVAYLSKKPKSTLKFVKNITSKYTYTDTHPAIYTYEKC
jgi:hypothetical protein